MLGGYRLVRGLCCTPNPADAVGVLVVGEAAEGGEISLEGAIDGASLAEGRNMVTTFSILGGRAGIRTLTTAHRLWGGGWGWGWDQ